MQTRVLLNEQISESEFECYTATDAQLGKEMSHLTAVQFKLCSALTSASAVSTAGSKLSSALDFWLRVSARFQAFPRIFLGPEWFENIQTD